LKDLSYDVVVIGAGNGGLAAAATTAQKGLKTLLVEQHNLPGGFASSFVRGRFEFEPSLHEMCDVGVQGCLGGAGEFFESIGLKVEWLRIADAYRMVVDGESKLDVTMPFGTQAYIDKMEEYVPGSRESVTNFFELSQEVVDGIGYIGKSKGNPDKQVLMSKYANFLKTASYTLDQVEKALKIPDKACEILNAYWCYIGTETSRVNFTIFAAMMLKFIAGGAVIPKNRSHEISLAFESRIREFGGDIMYSTKVDKILVEDGAVAGVLTTGGRKIKAKHVISNAAKHIVYSQMLEQTSEMSKECNSRRIGGKGYVAYFGLNKTMEEIGLTDYSYFIYPSTDTKKMYDSFASRDGDPLQAVVCLNNVNPGCSPEGTSMLTITTIYTDDAWDDVEEKNYVKAKNDIARKMIARFESVMGVSIADAIEEFEVASPETFARYTGAYDGGIYGYEPEALDSIMPRLMMLDDDMHVKGLRFCGGFAFRCHGYASSYMSGNTAGLLTYRDSTEVKS
jgi:phytoene dehydrogenase-like protein